MSKGVWVVSFDQAFHLRQPGRCMIETQRGIRGPSRYELAEAIEKARRGELNEYYLQQFFKDYYEEFDVTDLSGPFDNGCDFMGKALGKDVVIECERRPADFLRHGCKRSEVDVLVFMALDDTPRYLTPKIRIWVDPEEMIYKTYKTRNELAIKTSKEDFEYNALMILVAESLYSLWNECHERVIKGTLESHELNEAAKAVSALYLKHYNLEQPGPWSNDADLPEIMSIDNKVLKSGVEQLSEKEQDFLSQWMDLLDDEISRMD